MAFLYDYMTESERQNAIDEKYFEMEFTRLENKFRASRMKHELAVKNIEAKAIFENCTDDQLTAMYEAESLVYMEETQGIWQGIKNLIRQILDKITGRKKKELDGADSVNGKTVELDEDPGVIRQALQAIKKLFVKDEGTPTTLSVALGAIGTSVAVSKIAETVKNRKQQKTKMTVQQAQENLDGIQKDISDLNKEVDNAANAGKKGGFFETLIGAARAVISTAQNVANKIINGIKSVITKVTGHEFKSNDKNADQTTAQNTQASSQDTTASQSSDNTKTEEPVKDDKANTDDTDAKNEPASDTSKATETSNKGKSEQPNNDEYVTSVPNGDYGINFDRSPSERQLKPIIDDIIDYAKKPEVLKELSKKFYLKTNKAGKILPLNANDMTLDNLGSKGLSAVIKYAKSNGIQYIDDWDKCVNYMGKSGNVKDTKLLDAKRGEEGRINEKNVTKTQNAVDFNNPTMMNIVELIMSKESNRKKAYNDYPSIRDTIKNESGYSSMPNPDQKGYKAILTALSKTTDDAEKRKIFETFQKDFPKEYKDNQDAIDNMMSSAGVEASSTKGHMVNKHDDAIENEMIQFANTNGIELFGTQAYNGEDQNKFRQGSKSGNKTKKGKNVTKWQYTFKPGSVSPQARDEYFKRAANYLLNKANSIPDDVYNANLDQLKKFAKYLAKLYKYDKGRFNRDGVGGNNNRNLLESTTFDLDELTEEVISESTVSVDLDSILESESGLDALFESTTTELIDDIDNIFESTFNTTE